MVDIEIRDDDYSVNLFSLKKNYDVDKLQDKFTE